MEGLLCLIYPPKCRFGPAGVLFLNVPGGYHATQNHHNRSAGVIQPIQWIRNGFQFIDDLSYGDIALMGASLQGHSHNIRKADVFQQSYCELANYRRFGWQGRAYDTAHGVDQPIQLSDLSVKGIAGFGQLYPFPLSPAQHFLNVRPSVLFCHA